MGKTLLNYLISYIAAKDIKSVGFDLDGTIYSEFDFIEQVYAEVIKESRDLIKNRTSALSWMKKRWLEKGSSYNLIFDETYELFGIPGPHKPLFIERSLQIYRSFNPKLELSELAAHILGALKLECRLFLVTDGNPGLQRRKFNSLGLGDWFLEKDCVFTGDYGTENYKPSVTGMREIFSESSPSSCLFIGDRDVDEEFAACAGMSFVRVSNMVLVK